MELTNKSKPKHDGRHFTNDILKYIFVNETICILSENPLKFVP